MTEPFTHTVFCPTAEKRRQDFTDIHQAVKCANQLLVQGHKSVIRPYKPPKRAIDYTLERLEKEGRL